MPWFYLFVAGLCEIGWPLGLKYGWREEGIRWWPLLGAVASMGFSGLFLFLAQRTIPMGTAYAVWTGIGSVGAFLAGIYLFREPAHMTRVLCVFLIVTGIVGLKFISKD
ncbi:MAG TPA: multidrug efflux SMR transporter [Gemmatales bacterium]|nr:multidrug efflux SMR transporter [Gemmatales bacterium]HMP17963.1 multidrug efflux SMR transporter [Gemmatales bacterium]